jgi:hypothetical protein
MLLPHLQPHSFNEIKISRKRMGLAGGGLCKP